MSSHSEIVNNIMWNWDSFDSVEIANMCSSLSFKHIRWLVSHHPDNKTRKLLLRMTNVSCGKDTVINSGFIVSDDYEPLLMIGDRVAIAPNVTVICSSAPNNSSLRNLELVQTRYIKTAPVQISDDSWIGAGAILLPGIKIGKGAIIGAASLVTQNIPPATVAAGIPAKVLRNLINT